VEHGQSRRGSRWSSRKSNCTNRRKQYHCWSKKKDAVEALIEFKKLKIFYILLVSRLLSVSLPFDLHIQSFGTHPALRRRFLVVSDFSKQLFTLVI
jgi:hypothetical protein